MQVKSINLLLASEIQDVSDLEWDFCDLRVLARKFASPFAQPTQVSGQSSTFGYLRLLPSLYAQFSNGSRKFLIKTFSLILSLWRCVDCKCI